MDRQIAEVSIQITNKFLGVSEEEAEEIGQKNAKAAYKEWKRQFDRPEDLDE